jgi:ABC-type antimicrobial peptide transport system permease subunit
MSVNAVLLKTAVRVWLMEILVSGFNFFVLMNLVYEPRWGVLVAHQIGMSSRIVYISIFAYLLLRYVKKYQTKDLAHVGLLWLGLTLVFEWGGSFAIGRPVDEILIGWNIFAGYLWPYVLLTYLLSPLIVGTILHPGKKPM